MNPLGNNQVNPVLQNLANTINFARSFQSPEAFMQELQRQNPQEAQRLMQLSRTIQNPMQYAMGMLQQQGISPQQLNSLLNK